MSNPQIFKTRKPDFANSNLIHIRGFESKPDESKLDSNS